MERLRQETNDTGVERHDHRAGSRGVDRLQSELARQAAEGKALDAGGLEAKFGTGFGGGDWFGWIRSVFDHVDRRAGASDRAAGDDQAGARSPTSPGSR